MLSAKRDAKARQTPTVLVVEPNRKPERHAYWELRFDPDPKPTAAEW